MKLNDFLGFRLGVEFEDKYNILAVKEVLDNKDKYPVIYPYIENEVLFDDDDKLIEKDYDFGFFDCDDESCAGVNEALELNKVFSILVLRDLVDQKLRITSVSFGLDYIISPTISCVMDPCLNYRAISYITLRKSAKVIGMQIFNHNIIDGTRYGHLGSETHDYLYYEYNDIFLDKLNDSFRKLGYGGIETLYLQRFSSDDLPDLKTEIKGEECYYFDSYELRVGENLIKFNTTERGFDPFGIVRIPVEESLTKEQRNLDIVKRIFGYKENNLE